MHSALISTLYLLLLSGTPPSVSLTAPADHAVIPLQSSVVITATAADPDGSVAQVEFFRDGQSLGQATAAPYSVTWNAGPSGTYVLTAEATDNEGNATVSDPVSVTVDTPPAITLSTSPSPNTALPAPASITLNAAATDADGSVTGVTFYQDGNPIGTVSQAPYTLSLSNVAAGTYSYTAQATDNLGLTTLSKPVVLSVNASPLAVGLSSPQTGQVLAPPTTVTLTADVQDTANTVERVDFYQGATLLGSATTAPYSFDWANVPVGTYSLTAVATDSAQATATSSPVTLTVDTPPTVTLSTDTRAAKTPASFTLTADANDADGNLASVAFYQNGTLIQSLTAAPYSMDWSNVAAGNYTLTAVATDSLGVQTVSDPVSVSATVERNLNVYYIQTDQLNTPRLITDAQNNAVWEDLPDEPFGASVPNEDPNQTGTPFVFNLRFPGQYYDSESGLSYNLNRDYDPSLGRYVESDPLGLTAGVNTYSYVNGNPITLIDLLGLSETTGSGEDFMVCIRGLACIGGIFSRKLNDICMPKKCVQWVCTPKNGKPYLLNRGDAVINNHDTKCKCRQKVIDINSHVDDGL